MKILPPAGDALRRLDQASTSGQNPSRPEDTKGDQVDPFVAPRPDDASGLDEQTAATRADAVAEMIRRRQDSGFYHQPEVLRLVAARLVEDGEVF